MAVITVNNSPEEIAANNIVDNTLAFDPELVASSETQTLHVTMDDENTGVIKFNVGKDAGDSDAEYAAGDEEFIQFSKNRPVHFIQTVAADVFKVSII